MESEKMTVILPIEEYRKLIIENNELSRIDRQISDVNTSIQNVLEYIHCLHAKLNELRQLIERSNEE